TNCGNVPLIGVVVVDDNGTPGSPSDDIIIPIGTLDVGGSTPWTATNTLSGTSCGPFTNTATATGTNLCTGALVGPAAAACVTVVTTSPHIAVTMNCPVAPAITGGLITYSGTVSNSGNVPLMNVVVASDKTSPGTVLSLPVLAVGASAN